MKTATGNRRFDVAIIGGGLTGCGAAFHLVRKGASVLLVERAQINAGASGQNAGSLHFQLERRLVEHDSAASAIAARTLLLSRAAIRDWRALEALLGTDLEVVMAGGLMVAETAEEMALLERKQALEATYGLDVELLDGPEARLRAPYLSDRVIGAAFCPHEGHAGPRVATVAFARAAEAAGACITTEIRVGKISRSPLKGFVLDLVEEGGRTERVSADIVLAAAGAWTMEVGQLANVHLPLFPLALTMTATERCAPLIPHLVQHAGKRLSLKQTHAGNLLIGGGWPARLRQRNAAPYGFDLERRAVLRPPMLIENLNIACGIVPAVANLNVLRTWTGIVAETPDHLPVLGEVSEVPGFYVAAGGSGFTLGPTVARVLSEMILTGTTSEDVSHFSPARFGGLNSTMGL